MDVYGIIQKEYGVNVDFAENRVTDTVNTTVTKIAMNNPNRLGLIILNLGAYDIYVAPTSDVSLDKGILLTANGGGISFNLREDFMLPALSWYAIANGGASKVYVLEVIAV